MVLDDPAQLEDAAVRAMWTKAMTFLKAKQCAAMASVSDAQVISGNTVLAAVSSSLQSNWAFAPRDIGAAPQVAASTPAEADKSETTEAASVAAALPPSVPETPSGTAYPAFSSKTWTLVQEVGLADARRAFDVSHMIAEGPYYGDWQGELNCGKDDTTFWEAPTDIIMSVYKADNPQAIEIEQWYSARGQYLHSASTAYIDGDTLVTTRADAAAIMKNMVYQAMTSAGEPILVTPFNYHRFQCQITYTRVNGEPETYISVQQRIRMAQQIDTEFEAAPWRGSDFGKVKGGELIATCQSITAWLDSYPADHRTPLGKRVVLRHFSDADLVSATGWTAYDWMMSKYGDRAIAFEKWMGANACRQSMSKEDYNLFRRVGRDSNSWKALRSRMRVDAALTGVVATVLEQPYKPLAIANLAKAYSENPTKVFGRESFDDGDVAQLRLLMNQIRTVMLADAALTIAATVSESSSLEELREAEEELAKLAIDEEAKAATLGKVRQHMKVAGMALLKAEVDKLSDLEPTLENLPRADDIRNAANTVVNDYLGGSNGGLVSVAYAEFFAGVEEGVFTDVESSLDTWDKTAIEPGQASERVAAVQELRETIAQLDKRGGNKEMVAALNSRLDEAVQLANLQLANEEVASITERYTTAEEALKNGEFRPAMKELDFVDGKLAEMMEVGALDAIDTLKTARQAFWRANLDTVADMLLDALSDAHANGEEKQVRLILPVVQNIADRLTANGDPETSARFASKVDAAEAEIGGAAIEQLLTQSDLSLDLPIDIVTADEAITVVAAARDAAWTEAAMVRQWKAKRLGYMEAAVGEATIRDAVSDYLSSHPYLARELTNRSLMYLDRSRFTQLAAAALMRQVTVRTIGMWEKDALAVDDTDAIQRIDALRRKFVADVNAFALAVLDDAEDDIEDITDEELENWHLEIAAMMSAEMNATQKLGEDLRKALFGTRKQTRDLFKTLIPDQAQIIASAKMASSTFMRINASGGLVPDASGWTELTSDQKKIRNLALEWTKAEAERIEDWRCEKTRRLDDADDDLLEAPLLGAENVTVQGLACEMDNGNLKVGAIVELSDDSVEIQTETEAGEFWKFRVRVTEVAKGKSLALVYEYASPFETFEVKKDEWEVLLGMLIYGQFEPEMIVQMVRMRVDPSAIGAKQENELITSMQGLWDGIVADREITLR